MAHAFFLSPDYDDTAYMAFFVAALMAGPMNYISETTESKVMGYSKFFNANKGKASVSSRLGMVMLYTPSLLASLLFATGYLKTRTPSDVVNIGGVLGAIQFGKRILESLFLHKYSGGMELSMIGTGSVTYALCVSQIIYFSKPAPLASASSLAGILLFLTGTLGNLYHHWLLRNLRKDGEKKYVVPRGGLFEYVACPHYMFELVAWLGIAVYARSAIGYAPVAAMVGYLSGRAKNTTKYYVEKLGDEYPKSRKHIFPFVF